MKVHIRPFHIGILIYMIQSGVSILNMPQVLAYRFGYNGWLILILFSCIAMINIYLISLVYRLGEGRSIFVILEQSFPKVLLTPIYIGIAGLWGMLGSLVAKKYSSA